MTYGELKRRLKKIDCYLDREGGNHEIWYSPITNTKFPVGRHNTEEVPPWNASSHKERFRAAIIFIVLHTVFAKGELII